MLFEEYRYVYEECTDQRAATIYEDCKRNSRTTESLNFLLFNFCNDCLFVEVSTAWDKSLRPPLEKGTF